jgi:GH15 family glucan-1,4-alpha-glucosidase
MPLLLEDYALIGDCRSAALVGRDGSIDWLCWPRFDSDACFAALLGTAENGRWLIAPKRGGMASSRRYRADTLILETRFETESGVVEIHDFMPPGGTSPQVMRRVECLEGSVSMAMELVLRFGYGADVPWVSRIDRHSLRAVCGPDMAVLRSEVPMRGADLRTIAEFELQAGESCSFSLAYGLSHLEPPVSAELMPSMRQTEAFWRDWVARCKQQGTHDEAVVRSLITLRALIYAPTGGIVAAPTTALPERIGGERNWDYRYCWLRDATLTLLAFMNSGYYEEAAAWRDWLLRAIAGSPAQLQIMYGVAGERRLSEWQVPWLAGYEGSVPVRIGNAAHAQLQLDVYGEVMDALHQARCGGLGGGRDDWHLQRALLRHLEGVWRDADSGMWEVRGPPQHFTFSKVMAWVAFDRAVKAVEHFGLDGPVEHWRRVRQTIHDDVCEKGYDPLLGSFVQAYGARQLDAALLQLPAVGFIAAGDARFIGTVAAIESRLLKNGLVMRYDTAATDDGLAPGEGVFLACSFWLVDAYAMLGRSEDARRLFERLLALRNDVGLLAEEFDPGAHRLLGNFPQAFSHLALVASAHNLFGAQRPAEQRSAAVPHSAAVRNRDESALPAGRKAASSPPPP